MAQSQKHEGDVTEFPGSIKRVTGISGRPVKHVGPGIADNLAWNGQAWAPGGLRAFSVSTYGAKGDGHTDDTNRIQAAANAAAAKGVLYFPPGTYIAEGIVLPANTTIMAAPGAAIKGKNGGTANILQLAGGCRVYGLEIDGNKANRTAGYPIVTSAVSDVIVRDCYIHDSPTRGIELDTTTKYLISGCRIEGCATQAIMCNVSSGGRVHQNAIDSCGQGIEVWGGAAPGAVGVTSVDVVGNSVSNTTGAGIWTSCGERIVFANNILVTIGDVAVDFEGSIHCAATGNIIRDATNGAITAFFGSSHIAISGNQIYQSGTQDGIYCHSTTTSSFLNITGNEIHTNSGMPIRTDSTALVDSNISQNTILQDGNAQAILILDGAGRCSIVGNRITQPGGASGLKGIAIQGPSDCLISNNYVLATAADTAVAAGSYGGIWLFRRSSTYPAKRNTVSDNYVKGFFASINDDCFGDTDSRTLIRNNRVETIYHRSGTWSGLSVGNVSVDNPNTPIGNTTF